MICLWRSMGGSFGPDARLGAPATEGLFREQLLSALAQWHQRLARPNAPAAEAGAIAQEAAQLRAVAQSRGWATVQHLLYLENIALNAPRGLLQAIAAIANALRAAPPAGPAQHTVVLPQAAAVRAAGRSSAPPPGPPQPGSPLPAPPQQAPAGQPSLVLPPSHAALAPPSLIEASPRAASAPPPRHPDSTLYSAQTPGRPAGAPAAADQGPVGAPSPLPPDSLPKQRPPSLLARSILGLRAFRGKAGGPEQAAGAPYDPPIVDKPLFGFRPLSSQPAPPPAGRLSSRPPAEPKPSKARRSSRPRSRPSARSEAPVPRWYYLLIALAGLLGAATVVTVVVLGRRAKQPLESNRAVAPTKSGAPAAAAAAPQAPGTDPSASQIEQIATAVHKGGTETPELRALLDLQGKLATSCRDDPTMCGRGWTPLAREALTPVDVKDFTPSSGDAPLAAWLKRLKLPRELGVRDEPALRSSFDFNTKNIAGRQALQAKLFECSAYADIFDSTFIKYGAPGWLTAVVYQESACNPRATSSVGAKGL
ncbi:MAG TPA: hypothetical protein VE987_18770, partial [Polyangiaceae bacterium]|nr:hypothetical protein [Polyangiaceae bacterium]